MQCPKGGEVWRKPDVANDEGDHRHRLAPLVKRVFQQVSGEPHHPPESLAMSGKSSNTDPMTAPKEDHLHRARGALLGLAVGDAIGTTVEFRPRGSFKPLTDMVGGGPFGLEPGQFTDDTSMALCLAASLIDEGFDLHDQMARYTRWANDGYMSSNGRCFDIGIATRGALQRFQRTGNPLAGSTDPQSAGNGCIMRLAPCIIWNRNSLSAAIGESVAQALLTHGSSDCITYTAALAHELWEGRPLPQYDHLRDRPINNSGYVADTYASAWYSVRTTKSFHAAIVDAINRGEDADTVGAVAGMIAGRIYGNSDLIGVSELVKEKEIAMYFDQLTLSRQ